MKPLRIVVTGAKGFLGSVFSLRAIERGHTVIALDDESRGENPIEQKIGGHYFKHDCRHGFHDFVTERTAPHMLSSAIDAVAHFAAGTGSLDRPLPELMELNVEMMRACYQDAHRLGAKAFLWPTTSLALAVPDSPYVASKEEGLRVLREVDADTGISVPLRFFNVAGAYKGLSELRKNEVHLIPEIARAAVLRTVLPINGDDYDTIDGTPSRDFVHVLDVVEYLLDIAEARVETGNLPSGIHPHYADEAIWLGKGYSTTVREAVRIYSQMTGRAMSTRVVPRRAFDCGSLEVHPSQAQQFAEHRGGLAPAWVSIRDEAVVLEEWFRAWTRDERDVVSGEINTQAVLASQGY